MNKSGVKLFEVRINLEFSIVFRILFQLVQKLEIFFRIFLGLLGHEQDLKNGHKMGINSQYFCL